jgi:NAD(P)-dependent dehydrogenase (short-subunit alcohol dehydrogenase family)
VSRIALVTGANRGIGLEVARQLAARGDTVFLGARDPDAGRVAAEPLIAAGGDVHVRLLDVTDQGSIDLVAGELARGVGRLDVLINNAAIHYDTWQRAIGADSSVVLQALDTNLLGAWRCANAFIPLLRASGHGRIVNVSSEAGSLASMSGGTPAYAVSKLGLNGLTRMLAAQLRPHVLVNSVCPGWVATDMGGPGGRPVQDGAASILWAADLPDNGPTGGFFRDGRPIPF